MDDVSQPITKYGSSEPATNVVELFAGRGVDVCKPASSDAAIDSCMGELLFNQFGYILANLLDSAYKKAIRNSFEVNKNIELSSSMSNEFKKSFIEKIRVNALSLKDEAVYPMIVSVLNVWEDKHINGTLPKSELPFNLEKVEQKAVMDFLISMENNNQMKAKIFAVFDNNTAEFKDAILPKQEPFSPTTSEPIKRFVPPKVYGTRVIYAVLPPRVLDDNKL